jgi:mannose-1-phosphate guanylyltransferase/mannose-6-phosphate isomerase
MQLLPVILSGGSGTRLWPLSREAYPKQFLPLAGSNTMVQATVRRLAGLSGEHPHCNISVLDPLVICNEEHRFLVAEQLRELEQPHSGIVLEPEGRNTAPALTLAALRAEAGNWDDPLLLVMPADHLIGNETVFRAVLAKGCGLASDGRVVTFGVVPTRPETGYGYIRKGTAIADAEEGIAYLLDSFTEKPDTETAQQYLADGAYLWNSGIFLMRTSRWLELIGRMQPAILGACREAVTGGLRDGDFFRVDAEAFHKCPSDSIDYAVMERLAAEGDEAVVLALDAEWSDIGAWSSLWEIRPQDEAGNVCEGDVFAFDSRDNLLLSHSRMVAAVGVNRMVIIETPDALLVADRERVQDVKEVIKYLKAEQRDECRFHQRVHRPWGAFEPIGKGARYQVKRITVSPGASLSLQMHHHRAEHWIVVSGTAKVTRGDEILLLSENESTYIPPGVKHRLENPGAIPLELIEVQSGGYLGEDDIVRFEDVYNRTSDD